MKLTDIYEMDIEFGGEIGEEDDNKPQKFDLEIHVEKEGSGIAPEHSQWIATLDDYDGAPDSDHPIGTGDTPVAALDDLRDKAHETHTEYSEASMTAAFEKAKKKYAS